MDKKVLIIAVDPSEHGFGTSGTGIAWAKLAKGVLVQEYMAIFGKNYTNQTEYNNAVINDLKYLIEEHQDKGYKVFLRIEEFVDQQLKERKFKVNGVAEMIGVLKYMALQLKVPVTMRNAQTIKTRWNEEQMEAYEMENKGLPLTVAFFECDGVQLRISQPCYAEFNNLKSVKHQYDARRHLADELFFGKEWKKVFKNG